MTVILTSAYIVLLVQLSLGVGMIATASVAANLRINTPADSVEIVLYVLGCSSLCLGVWALVMISSAIFFQVAPTLGFLV